MLASLAEPFQSAGGRPVYPTVRHKAAALFRNLAKSQHLVDGNKRVAVTTVTAFLRINGFQTTYTNGQLYRYALRVAAHAGNFPFHRIHAWIQRHTALSSPKEVEEDRAQNQKVYDDFDAEGGLLPHLFSWEANFPAGEG